MARTSAPKTTRASVALGEIAARDRFAEVGRRLQLDEASVRNYVAGRRTPTPAVQARIESVFGIASGDWRRARRAPPPSRPQGASPPRAESAKHATPREPLGDPVPAPDHDFPTPADLRGASAEKLLAVVVEFLGQMRGEAKTWAPRDRVTLGSATTAAIRALSVARGERLSEAAILRHPIFRRTVDSVLAPLASHPDALRAVVSALEQLETEAGERGE